ncbi:MAG: proton-conducting transporter membrane subunit, partial [Nitrosopumilaceae archaeon]
MEYALLQAVFIPLLLSPIAYILGRKMGATPVMWFTFAILLYTTILVIQAALTGTTEEHYPWTAMFGEFGFLMDGLASPFAIMIYVLSTILVLYSKPYMIHKFHEQFEEEQKHLQSSTGQSTVVESTSLTNYVNAKSGLYFALYLVFAMGMLGTILATNLIEFYIFFEVMLIPAFFLVALWGDGPRRKIGLMFLFWTHAGAVVLLLGFLMIGLTIGSFDFVDIQESAIPQDIVMLSAIAIAIGLGVKLAVFMFHIWLPYVHGS